ncbi:PorP/SprF family type IX secretion system membrane protein [Echinicola sp. 20G]|uniref:PorP/SprF family type IX secretion system membrane protein n=1 Tax=Echinicola sp. 20G TaxID=2781961 RepID=UPI001910971D|nr:PorP/SprF family type IX secretion system membrane protein [Echinicola sp. 20G]
MKKIFILLIIILPLSLIRVSAQSRKYISHFSSFQSYFNPSLVGLEGSSAKSVVRNQWNGIQGAPKTVFGSVEGDFSQINGVDSVGSVGKSAIGLAVMYDKHGPFTETELLLNYTSRIQLSEKHHLGLGAGIKYMNTELDGNALTPEQSDDPSLAKYMGGFAEMKYFDFNVGLSLIHKNYYIGYSLQNVASGKISSGDDFYAKRPPIYNLQAGFRGTVSENVGLVGNVLYRLQEDLPYNAEFNFKALFMDKVWLGVGHRVDYSTSLQTGFVMDRFKVGYIYEVSTRSQAKMYGSTHEFMASIRLFNKTDKGIFGMW